MSKTIRTIKTTKQMTKDKLNLQFDYVLEHIKKDQASPEEKLAFFIDNFNKEYNSRYSDDRVSIHNRLIAYIIGLPQCFDVEYHYAGIIEIGRSWGFCQTFEESQRFVENWFKNIAFRIIQLCKKYNLDINKLCLRTNLQEITL